MLLYFIPSRIAETNTDLLHTMQAAGIGDIARPLGELPSVTPVGCSGPDGQSGLVLHYDRYTLPMHERELPFLPNLSDGDYRWVPSPKRTDGQPSFWIGHRIELPPTPEDMARPNALPGIPVKMADGNDWVFPVLRVVPRVYGMSDEGNWEPQIRPEYRQLCEMGERIFPRLRDAFTAWSRMSPENQQEPIPFAEGAQFIVLSLQQNYRITREMVGMLGLIDDYCKVNALGAPFEFQILIEWDQKKTR